ncbi:hypothetical protein GCM10008955_38710 [Deinococcus malanensis]|uniref:Uncharacterized protein n=1 Tax=Deinococcus malanensis TaxID=1706855 RepID=A0ABQ2F2M3_9DEIO|nr:hypothetical protein GCM10008955_38710 [Deinococcus malanensis]
MRSLSDDALLVLLAWPFRLGIGAVALLVLSRRSAYWNMTWADESNTAGNILPELTVGGVNVGRLLIELSYRVQV